jgi:hypothetical protein
VGFTRCYRGTRGTRAVATGVHSSDGESDISGPLLLPPIIATCSITSEDRCYCEACVTRVVADSAHNSDEPYGTSGLLLLWGM